MNIDDLLNRAKALSGVTYDKDLAKKLGLSHGSVSNYRKGISLPDVVTCEKLAEICGFPPLQVIAAINEQRAISAAEKKVWRRLATAAMLVTFGIACALPAYATAVQCRLCSMLRGVFRGDAARHLRRPAHLNLVHAT
jgi:transcriptional regulator with XRE-family HTH domain